MKKYIFLILSIIISAVVFGFVREDDPIKKILEQIEKYRSQYPQEKVHLHLDKPYYAIGDNIWFKAYVVTAEKNELSNLSKILYVDLINEDDSVKQSLTLPLQIGLTWGDFALSDSLKEGNYRIRAYTSWMRNFDEDYFFDKTITIGNSISNKLLTEANYTFSKEPKGQRVLANLNYTDLAGVPLSNKEVTYEVVLDFRSILKGKALTDTNGTVRVSFLNNQPFILKSGKINTNIRLDEKAIASKSFLVKTTSNETDVQFFPEGGDLIEGITSRVAFKALGSDGLGLPVSGYIADENQNRLIDFNSEFAGMGSFKFKPSVSSKYTAHIIFKDGSEKTIPLPKVRAKGYVLSADNSDSTSLRLRISTNELQRPDAELKLVAQSNGQVLFVAKNKMNSSVFSSSIPKSRFPTGILQLTLFSPNDEPVAERLVFINHSDQLNIKLSTEKLEYQKREKVKLLLDAQDKLGKPTLGSFSISVIDETKVPFDEENETSIISNLLLSSDLKGFIEKPNYYFTSIDADKVRHLDNLLLTQGWRRFEWKNILSDNYPSLIFEPENSMQVSGEVRSMSGKPLIGGKVTLFSSSGTQFLLDTLTDNNGRFKFDNLYFNDSTKFIVQARNEKDKKNVEILLDRIPDQLVTKNKNKPMVEINVNKSIFPYLKNSRDQYDDLRKNGLITRNIMLDEVKIVEKKVDVKYSSNLNGAGVADAIVKAEQLQNCFTIIQCIQGRFAGIMVLNNIVYASRNMTSSFSGPIPMQVIIDGAFVEPEFLSSINPNDVETIEILKSAGNTAIYGLRGGGGVLIVNTKRGEYNTNYRNYAPGITGYNPRGYSMGREFYSPNYGDPATNTKLADLRTTIYWNPNVISDSTGKASVEFYNSDGKGKYKAIVEGVNIDGTIGRHIFRYNVE
jgi:TonB-dependent SusC/RagA subfamily outer membrane receptor